MKKLLLEIRKALRAHQASDCHCSTCELCRSLSKKITDELDAARNLETERGQISSTAKSDARPQSGTDAKVSPPESRPLPPTEPASSKGFQGTF